jgi:drug/metabolite transporter (DMT)-like permease
MADPAARATSAPHESPRRTPGPRSEGAQSVGKPGASQPASAASVATAFALVYVIWGSTYLAIRYAIETVPPFVAAGGRFLIAGTILFAWAWLREGVRPTRAQWVGTTIVGALLLVGGNGAVSWSEQFVPSGLAALIVAITPFWMVMFEWLRRGGDRPSRRTMLGLGLGFIGLVILVGPSGLGGGEQIHLGGVLVLLGGSITWAVGSIWARSLTMPRSATLSTGMQMLAGGTLLLGVGAIAGELPKVDPGAISTRSLLALLYLILFGAVIGFTAYTWLLTHTTPARLSTYAYVNPVVALLLGWAIAGEPLSGRTLVAAAVILVAVAVITLDQARKGAGGH